MQPVQISRPDLCCLLGIALPDRATRTQHLQTLGQRMISLWKNEGTLYVTKNDSRNHAYHAIGEAIEDYGRRCFCQFWKGYHQAFNRRITRKTEDITLGYVLVWGSERSSLNIAAKAICSRPLTTIWPCKNRHFFCFSQGFSEKSWKRPTTRWRNRHQAGDELEMLSEFGAIAIKYRWKTRQFPKEKKATMIILWRFAKVKRRSLLASWNFKTNPRQTSLLEGLADLFEVPIWQVWAPPISIPIIG